MAALSSTVNFNTPPLTPVEFPPTDSLSSSSSSSERVRAIATATMSSSSSSSVASPNTPKTPIRKLEKKTSIESPSSLLPPSSTPNLDPKLDSESERDWELAQESFNVIRRLKTNESNFFRIIELLDRVLKKHPTYLPALEMRLCIHRHKLQMECVAEFDVLRILSILKERLEILFDSKHYEEANQKLILILKLKPDDAFALNYQKLLNIKELEERLKDLLDSRHYDVARVVVDLILELQPDNQVVIDLLTVATKPLEADLVVLLNSKSFDKAREMAKFILKLQPNNHTVKGYLNVIIEPLQHRLVELFKLKNYDAARSVIRSILELQPVDPLAINYMKQIHQIEIKASQDDLILAFHSKDHAAAINILNKLLRVTPEYAERSLQDYLANLFNSRNYDAAKEIASKIIPEYANKYLGAVYVQMGQDVKAVTRGIKHLNLAFNHMPKNKFILFYLALAYHRMNSRDQALVYVEDILKLNPSDQEALSLKKRIQSQRR